MVVGVSKDELVELYKNYKPFIPFKERFEIIKELKPVDIVIKQEILHDIKILKKYKVDVATIGNDWETRYLEGLKWMKKIGKKYYTYLIQKELVQQF